MAIAPELCERMTGQRLTEESDWVRRKPTEQLKGRDTLFVLRRSWSAQPCQCSTQTLFLNPECHWCLDDEEDQRAKSGTWGLTNAPRTLAPYLGSFILSVSSNPRVLLVVHSIYHVSKWCTSFPTSTFCLGQPCFIS